MMLIKPEQKQDGIKPKAEFVIKLSWDNANTSDVDLWVRDPAGNIAFFREKEVGLMHLDRDDLGKKNDTIIMPNGKNIDFPYNEELLILRGIMEGEYIVNVHLFSMNTTPPPTKATIRIEKLNPFHRVVFEKTVTLEYIHHEITVTRFTMRKDGWIMEYTDLPMMLIDDTNAQLQPRNFDFGAGAGPGEER
jgi:hypothetical protein